MHWLQFFFPLYWNYSLFNLTLDQWFFLVEVLLLVWVVIQGEYIRYYEREVHSIHVQDRQGRAEREEERRMWREQYRKAVLRKLERAEKAEKTVVLDSNTEHTNRISSPLGG
jgi:putative exporter of polyketide antibiotics